MKTCLRSFTRSERGSSGTCTLRLATRLVFPATEAGADAIGARAMLDHLARASKRAGLPIAVTPRVLRRTVNTLMVNAGIDRLVIRAILGHTSEAMTETYDQAPDREKMAALTRLVRLG